MVMTPALSMEKKPSAEVEVPVAEKRKETTPTASAARTVATGLLAAWFSL